MFKVDRGDFDETIARQTYSLAQSHPWRGPPRYNPLLSHRGAQDALALDSANKRTIALPRRPALDAGSAADILQIDIHRSRGIRIGMASAIVSPLTSKPLCAARPGRVSLPALSVSFDALSYARPFMPVMRERRLDIVELTTK